MFVVFERFRFGMEKQNKAELVGLGTRSAEYRKRNVGVVGTITTRSAHIYRLLLDKIKGYYYFGIVLANIQL